MCVSSRQPSGVSKHTGPLLSLTTAAGAGRPVTHICPTVRAKGARHHCLGMRPSTLVLRRYLQRGCAEGADVPQGSMLGWGGPITPPTARAARVQHAAPHGHMQLSTEDRHSQHLQFRPVERFRQGAEEARVVGDLKEMQV